MSDNQPPPRTNSKPAVPEVTSEELLRGHKELLIRHGEETYRLKLTRSGKLILQK
jgi:hemin uptake protein HemP